MVDEKNSDGNAEDSSAEAARPPQPPEPTAVEPTPPDPPAPVVEKPQSEGGKEQGVGAKQEQSRVQILEDRIRKSDRWMISLTAVAAFAAIVSAVIFGYQLSVMRGQLNLMETDERPWIKIIPPDKIFFAGVAKRSFALMSTFKAKNVGHSPANGVWMQGMLVIRPSNINELNKRAIEFCSGPLSAIFPDARRFGYAEFPEETHEFPIWGATQSADVPKKGKFKLALIVCADYRIREYPEHHTTAGIFYIAKVPQDGDGSDFTSEQQFFADKTSLLLFPATVDGGYAD